MGIMHGRTLAASFSESDTWKYLWKNFAGVCNGMQCTCVCSTQMDVFQKRGERLELCNETHRMVFVIHFIMRVSVRCGILV